MIRLSCSLQTLLLYIRTQGCKQKPFLSDRIIINWSDYEALKYLSRQETLVFYINRFSHYLFSRCFLLHLRKQTKRKIEGIIKEKVFRILLLEYCGMTSLQEISDAIDPLIQ